MAKTCYCCGHLHAGRRAPLYCDNCGFRLCFYVKCTECNHNFLKWSGLNNNQCADCSGKVDHVYTIESIRKLNDTKYYLKNDNDVYIVVDASTKLNLCKNDPRIYDFHRTRKLYCLRQLLYHLRRKLIARNFYYFIQECIMTRKTVIERMVERRYKEYVTDWKNLEQKLRDDERHFNSV